MKHKNNNEKRNYNLKKISECLNNINQKLLNKFGKLDYIIYKKWAEIVGIFFIQHSQPLKIISIPKTDEYHNVDNFERILHVNVTPVAAVEFQHYKNKIIEKINSFLGYQAIHNIKIHQKLINKNIPSFSQNINKSDVKFNQKKTKIKDTIQKINDKELEQSLLNLGMSITKDAEE